MCVCVCVFTRQGHKFLISVLLWDADLIVPKHTEIKTHTAARGSLGSQLKHKQTQAAHTCMHT